jgi:hypothetical protein
MDIRSYSTMAPSSSSSSEEESEVPPAKKPCVSSRPELWKKHHATGCSTRKYQKRCERDFTWLEYDADCEGAFCKLCKTSERSLERTGGVWTTNPFTNWKKAVEKMKAHAQSDAHIMASQSALAYQA